MNRLYTIRVRGGTAFTFQLEGNPVFSHGGGTSATNLMLTEEEADSIRGLALIHGAEAEVWPMPGQSEEQAALRKGLLFAGKLAEPRWATPECPQCPWFAPDKPSGCGVISWEPEEVETLERTSELHVKARRDCPERGVGAAEPR